VNKGTRSTAPSFGESEIGVGGVARATWALRCAYLALFAVLLSPALAFDFPAMVDYPNHLARMFILSREGLSEPNKFYEVTWALYPNLAMDVVVPLWARLMSVEAATRLFYLLSQLLVISGAIVLEHVVKGRAAIAPLTAAMFLYTLPFAWGFVNFEFGFGAALWAILAWLLSEGKPLAARFVINCVAIGVLFFAHFFAFGVYGAVIGLHELWRLSSGNATLKSTASTLAMLAAPVAALLILMAYFGGSVGGTAMEWGLNTKLRGLFHAMSGYSFGLSAACMYFVLATLALLALRRHLHFTKSGRWIVLGFALLFIAMPFRLLDTTFADVRIVSAAAFIFPAFLQVSYPSRHWRFVIASASVICAVANLALIWFVWASYRPDYDALIASFAQIAKGSTVLVAHGGDAKDPPEDLFVYPIYHAPTLAVAYADALVPTFFSYPGKQPVTVRPPYRHLSLLQGEPVPVGLLRAAAEAGTSKAVPEFIRNWPGDFDYLYVVGPSVPNPFPNLLRELAKGTRFVLYKIERPPDQGSKP
jgi:hypothetical protein